MSASPGATRAAHAAPNQTSGREPPRKPPVCVRRRLRLKGSPYSRGELFPQQSQQTGSLLAVLPIISPAARTAKSFASLLALSQANPPAVVRGGIFMKTRNLRLFPGFEKVATFSKIRNQEGFPSERNYTQQTGQQQRPHERRLDKTQPGAIASNRCSRPATFIMSSAEPRGVWPTAHLLIHALAWEIGLIDATDERCTSSRFHLSFMSRIMFSISPITGLEGNSILKTSRQPRPRRGVFDRPHARRIPDLTTAGDFCRFTPTDIDTLQ